MCEQHFNRVPALLYILLGGLMMTMPHIFEVDREFWMKKMQMRNKELSD